LSLAQVLAQTNCEPEQRVIQSQNGQSNDITVDGENSSEEASTRRSIRNRQPTKRYLERDLEESD
jgi:hypothetical protein